MLDPKWTGTVVDRREMRNLQLHQVVRRNFNKISMFGFATTLLCTWEVVAGTFGLALINGGTAGLFWNYIIAAIGLGFVYSSIAELASLFPTSGGQYFWVAVLAPRPYRRYLSYVTGWLCVITWQAAASGPVFLSATMIQGLIVLNHPDTYIPKQWHGSLLMLAFLIICIMFNTLLAKRLPMVEKLFVLVHIFGIFIFVPLWTLSPTRMDGPSPLIEFYNPGGWSSYGIATLVGSAAPVTALIGFDCSVHMAEEANDSSRTIPLSLLAGYTTNVVLGFFVAVTCIYTVGSLNDPATLAPTPNTGYLIINMFYNATNNLAVTNFIISIIIINYTAACIAALAAASRQLWAFARNGGTPFPKVLAPDYLPYDIPLNAVILSGTVSIIIALINMGSNLVLQILLSIVNSALISSYTITIGCVLMHRLRGRLPQARFSLGKWGALTNILALIYILPIFVFTFFPSAPNPVPSTMNWAILMLGGPIILATAYYLLGGRHTYTPPEETVDDFIKRYESTMESSNKDMSDVITEKKTTEEMFVEQNVDVVDKLD